MVSLGAVCLLKIVLDIHDAHTVVSLRFLVSSCMHTLVHHSQPCNQTMSSACEMTRALLWLFFGGTLAITFFQVMISILRNPTEITDCMINGSKANNKPVFPWIDPSDTVLLIFYWRAETLEPRERRCCTSYHLTILLFCFLLLLVYIILGTSSGTWWLWTTFHLCNTICKALMIS